MKSTHWHLGVSKWPNPNRSDLIRSEKFGFESDSNEDSNQIGSNPIRFENLKKKINAKTSTNLQLIVRIGLMFELSSDYIFSNPIDLKSDQVNSNPVRTKICPLVLTQMHYLDWLLYYYMTNKIYTTQINKTNFILAIHLSHEQNINLT